MFCVILSSGTAFTFTPQLRHEQDRCMNILRFDSWIFLKRWHSRVMAGLQLLPSALQPSCGHAQLFNNSFCHSILRWITPSWLIFALQLRTREAPCMQLQCIGVCLSSVSVKYCKTAEGFEDALHYYWELHCA